MTMSVPERVRDRHGHPLLAALVEDLAAGRSGAAFIGVALERLVAYWQLSSAVAVVEDQKLGVQCFAAARDGVDSERARLRALHRRPAVYTDPALPDHADVVDSIFHLCTVAWRIDRLHYLSTHDALTGLFNRRGFDEQLAMAVNRSVRYGWPFTLALIDLNRFKDINDRLGHPVGDAVLRSVGERLARTLRAGDVAGRIGGDEFGLLLPAYDAGHLDTVVQRLRLGNDIPGAPDIALSVGTASCPDEAADVQSLYALADQRLYARKAAAMLPPGAGPYAGPSPGPGRPALSPSSPRVGGPR